MSLLRAKILLSLQEVGAVLRFKLCSVCEKQKVVFVTDRGNSSRLGFKRLSSWCDNSSKKKKEGERDKGREREGEGEKEGGRVKE